MQIIKDKNIIESSWTHANDDTTTSDLGDITVSLNRWNTQNEELLKRSGKTGLRILPTDKVEDLIGNLNGIDLIELEFPNFGDGRLFSHARLLRDKLHYGGELRAVGNYLPDQAYFLGRVGVNAFLPRNSDDIPLILSCLSDFTVTYQS